MWKVYRQAEPQERLSKSWNGDSPVLPEDALVAQVQGFAQQKPCRNQFENGDTKIAEELGRDAKMSTLVSMSHKVAC